MIVLVNYANELMSISQEKLRESSLKYGVDKVIEYKGQKDLGSEFVQFNSEVFSKERGDGYWLWKPYIIYKAMLELSEGDILIYSDCGQYFIDDVGHIIRSMDEDIFFFSNGHQHVHWCKGDVIKGILGECKDECQQVQASVIFFKVNQKTKEFVREWLLWSQMPGFIDDSPSKEPNHPEFAEHRHDQAILTCLQIKYGYKLHWWADGNWYLSQRHKWPGDHYPPIFHHHRKRNNEW